MSSEDLVVPRSPEALQRQLAALKGNREAESRNLKDLQKQLAETRHQVQLAGEVSAALEQLSEQLFRQLLGLIEEKLSIALREVLEQDIRLVARAGSSHGKATVNFHIERDGEEENIQHGQGGSVANILSVGLRMFALTTLDKKKHRPVLVLDEQDCWLHPELVPRLVKIVHDAGEALGFQVIMISHHDLNTFDQFADKAYRIRSGAKGVSVRELDVTQTPDG